MNRIPEDCQTFQDRIMPCVRGELSPADRAQFDEHREACPECDRLLRTSCQEIVDFLHDYVAGDLDEPTALIFERHLQFCPPCLDFLESYRTTIDLERRTKEAELPPMPDQLVKAILDARRGD